MEAVLMDLGSVGPARVQVRGRSQAMRVEDEASCKCSAPYRAPELTQVANECDLDEKVDTWSLGCTAFCLAFGSSPFESPREGVLKLAILNAKFSFPQGHTNALGVTYSREFVALVASMLQVRSITLPSL
jgi:serine/threonine kinase 16